MVRHFWATAVTRDCISENPIGISTSSRGATSQGQVSWCEPFALAWLELTSAPGRQPRR
jgi:hypothetical protein